VIVVVLYAMHEKALRSEPQCPERSLSLSFRSWLYSDGEELQQR